MNEVVLREISINESADRWKSLIEKGEKLYADAKPFPFIIIDNFLDEKEALLCAKAFPASNEKTWTNYIHVNEKKYGLNRRESIPTPLLKIINDLQCSLFLERLSKITNTPGLIADEQLAGGGLHQMHPGGFLNVHSDFLIHPTKTNLMRRINLILFLSDDWEEQYGGDLQFWNKDMTKCITNIQPTFNRCVIFNTDEYSYHGCPDKLRGPSNFSRKSLALYYYTEYAHSPLKKYTDYKARPDDGNRKLAIYLDSKAVAVYSWIKQKLKLDDELVSQLLRYLKRR